MGPEISYPAYEAQRAPDARLAQLQAEAAQSAATVGSFRHAFRARVEEALERGEVTDAAASERLSAVDAVTDGHEGIRLDTTEAGVLGWNTIGGGRGGIRLSRATFAEAEAGDAPDVDQVVEHEAAHGKQVALTGELIVDGEKVSHLELYEGHAEIVSNEKTGKGINAHREGQPQEVYREGQDAVVKILSKVSRGKLESVLTGSGDLSELQRAIDGKAAEPSYAVAA